MRLAHKLHLAVLLKPQTLLARIQTNGYTWIQESLRKVTFILTGQLLNYKFQFCRRRKQSLGKTISFCHASRSRRCRGQDLLLPALVLSEAWGESCGGVPDILDKSPTWRNNCGSQRPGCSNSIIQISEQWFETPCGRICPVPYIPLSLSFTSCSPAWGAMVAMFMPKTHMQPCFPSGATD